METKESGETDKHTDSCSHVTYIIAFSVILPKIHKGHLHMVQLLVFKTTSVYK